MTGITLEEYRSSLTDEEIESILEEARKTCMDLIDNQIINDIEFMRKHGMME